MIEQSEEAYRISRGLIEAEERAQKILADNDKAEREAGINPLDEARKRIRESGNNKYNI